MSSAKIALAIVILTAAVLVTTASVDAGHTPSSPRSRDVIGRVRHRLEPALDAEGFRWGGPIYIRIFKKERTLEMWIEDHKRFRLFKSYAICFYGPHGLGPKTRQGDQRAPEGFYYAAPDQLNPLSDYHLAINIGYPNAYDRTHARTGSALMIHGACLSDGCYAMTDAAIEEIFTLADAALDHGQAFFRIHVFPFRMTEENMRDHVDHLWYPFWENLKEGYDWFQDNGQVPPNVDVRDGRYVFSSK